MKILLFLWNNFTSKIKSDGLEPKIFVSIHINFSVLAALASPKIQYASKHTFKFKSTQFTL